MSARLEPTASLVRGCGAALAVGAVLFIVANGIFTPLLPVDQAEETLRTSGVYLARMTLAVSVALLLLFGCLGLHLRHRVEAGRLGVASFIVAFIGTALLLAVEWSNLFVLPALAQVAPQALEPLDGARLYSAGFVASAGVFALGWALLCVSLWRSRAVPRWASATTLGGLFAVPMLGGPLGVPGMVAGNLILGAGLLGLGISLVRGG